MIGWQLTGAHAPLKLVELPDPQPGPGEIVVDPHATGLCHSDIGYQDGTLTGALGYLPIILGHEIAGTVSAIGAGVDGFRIGDRVAIKAGIETPGTRCNGGFATKVVSSAKFVVKIPDGLSFESAAVATDAGMTSYHAVIIVGQVGPGSRVGVVGLGGVGLFGAQIAAAVGATVYTAEPNGEARAAAAQFEFARYAADVSELAGLELDVVVDFAGFGTTTAEAIKAVKSGGRVVQVGLGRSEATISITTLVINQVELVGSLGGTTEDLDAVMKLLSAGKIKPMISTMKFNEVPDGFQRLERGEVRGRLVALINT